MWAVVGLHVNIVFITLYKLYVYAMQSLDLCCGASIFCSLVPGLLDLFNVERSACCVDKLGIGPGTEVDVIFWRKVYKRE